MHLTRQLQKQSFLSLQMATEEVMAIVTIGNLNYACCAA
jgi:hypothetical protein